MASELSFSAQAMIFTREDRPGMRVFKEELYILREKLRAAE